MICFTKSIINIFKSQCRVDINLSNVRVYLSAPTYSYLVIGIIYFKFSLFSVILVSHLIHVV